MSAKLKLLANRRTKLIAQSESQRAILATHFATWRTPLAMADRGIAALHFIQRHPYWLIGTALMLFKLQPRQLLSWGKFGWMALRISRQLRSK